jgi:hypothetical protein
MHADCRGHHGTRNLRNLPAVHADRSISPGRSSDWASSAYRRLPGEIQWHEYDERRPHSVGHVPEFHRLPDSPIEDGHLTDALMLIDTG